MTKLNGLLIVTAFLLTVFDLAGQGTYVEFYQKKDVKGIPKNMIAYDVHAYGDHDGKGIVNSANIIIDGETLGNYEIHRWESCVSTPGNGITYSPLPLKNPILNFVCMQGVPNGDRIGTLWLFKKEDRRRTSFEQLELKTRYNDLFFYSKVDGEKLNEETNQKIVDRAEVDISIYPNPFINEIQLMLKNKGNFVISKEHPVEVLLLDASGRIQAKFDHVVPEVNFYQRLTVPSIPAGTYYLSVKQNEEVLIRSMYLVKIDY